MVPNRYFPFVLITLITLISCSSGPSQIPNSVGAFLESYNWNIEQFSPSDVSELSDFREDDRYYLITENPSNVWAPYSSLDPLLIWQGRMARFGASYDPENHQTYTSVDDVPPVVEGQIVMLDLVVEDFLHMPVAFQVTSIDAESHSIVFTYLEENKSHGRQKIQLFLFESEGTVFTVLRHQTWYRSDSGFRDAFFYSHYHSQMIDEFHKSVASESHYKVKVISVKKLNKMGFQPG